MRYYHAVVHKDEGSAFGVHFPDLPGCFSAADEIEDVIPNATEALSLWCRFGLKMPTAYLNQPQLRRSANRRVMTLPKAPFS